MQKAMIAGNLGRDAEIKQVGGDTVCSFAVAVSGRRDEPATWYDCSLWGKRGEALSRYLTRGTKVAVTGTLGLRTYEKRDGSPGASMTIRVDDVTLQGGASDAGLGARRNDGPPPMDAPAPDNFNDDEIPF